MGFARTELEGSELVLLLLVRDSKRSLVVEWQGWVEQVVHRVGDIGETRESGGSGVYAVMSLRMRASE